jgi:hypothetical protein
MRTYLKYILVENVHVLVSTAIAITEWTNARFVIRRQLDAA